MCVFVCAHVCACVGDGAMIGMLVVVLTMGVFANG